MALRLTNLDGIVRIKAHLQRAANLDYTELMVEGTRILQEDNERRALAGLDCNDQPMPATQREKSVALSRRLGSGKPLDPNGKASRIVRTVQVAWTTAAPWRSFLRWTGFDAANGRSILGMHARPDAKAPYPRRDVVSHPSPTAVRKFRDTVKTFVRAKLRYQR